MSNQHTQSAPQASVPEKKGSGCRTAALILGVLGLLGIIALACLGFWGYSKAKDSFAMEPAKVAELTGGIADLSGLEGWEPQFGMNLGFMRMAAYNSAETEGMMMILDGKEAMFGAGEDFESQMRSQMKTQTSAHGDSSETTKEVSSTREDFTIAGETSNLLLAQSEGTDTGTKFTEVSGAFPSKTEGNNGFIYLRVPSEKMPIDAVRSLLGSIK